MINYISTSSDAMDEQVASISVSVLLPAFNAEKYLAEAVDSVLAQTHDNFELLLINDGSTDGTAEMIDAYAARDSRVRAIHHPNWGMGASLNHAIELAQHDWIARMDADDIMLPNRLDRQAQFIADNPDVDVAATLVEMIDAEGNPRWKTSSELVDRTTFHRHVRENRVLHIYHPSVLMRKSIVQAVGGYRQQFWSADDMDLWNRIAEGGGLILVQPEHLLQYRIHPDSASIADARDQMAKRDWVIACTMRRRQGLPEISFEEFLNSERSTSRVKRLVKTRQVMVETLYKRGTTLYLNGQRTGAVVPIAAAMLLNPVYCAGRIRSMLSKSSSQHLQEDVVS